MLLAHYLFQFLLLEQDRVVQVVVVGMVTAGVLIALVRMLAVSLLDEAKGRFELYGHLILHPINRSRSGLACNFSCTIFLLGRVLGTVAL